jgi:hypothetical protein
MEFKQQPFPIVCAACATREDARHVVLIGDLLSAQLERTDNALAGHTLRI